MTSLVNIEAINSIAQSTVIRARNGEELFRFFEEDRRWIKHDDISPVMLQAIVATEDKSFWSNDGTDMSSLIRAVWNNISSLWSNTPLQGGSTITQQLIKNVFLSNKKTFSRKFQELILARYVTETWKDRFVSQGL
jgi:membrane peptidoglycan carboxypeptidase